MFMNSYISFNSNMVRLKGASYSHNLFHLDSFNSNMVRLKEQLRCLAHHSFYQFQFQYGTIKSAD